MTLPGPPTQYGIYASPEWTGQPYPSLGWRNIRQDQEPPEGWPRPPKFNEPGDVPGPPVQYGDPITPQTVKAGYDFIDNGIIEKNLYFYHPDHLGSSSYITDREGRVTQHTEYIAFGEVLFEEHSVSPSMPYLFNGKELDQETNLTYFGARYLDMKTSLWLNVDPLAEKTMTPYAYTNNNPIMLVDPTGMESEIAVKPSPAEAAAMAAHVYGDKKDDILLGGWRVSKTKFKNIRLNDRNSGFKSQIYERVVNGKVTEYTYATAGTEDLVKDGITDIMQLFGMSSQYSISAKNATALSNQLGETELTYVGHSLGGGLAELNSNITRREAITFNAAGVGVATKFINGMKNSDIKGWFGGLTAAFRTTGLINAYIMKTDPLNIIQDKSLLLPNANGKRHYVIPTTIGSIYNGYSMDNVLREFGINPTKYIR